MNKKSTWFPPQYQILHIRGFSFVAKCITYFKMEFFNKGFEELSLLSKTKQVFNEETLET